MSRHDDLNKKVDDSKDSLSLLEDDKSSQALALSRKKPNPLKNLCLIESQKLSVIWAKNLNATAKASNNISEQGSNSSSLSHHSFQKSQDVLQLYKRFKNTSSSSSEMSSYIDLYSLQSDLIFYENMNEVKISNNQFSHTSTALSTIQNNPQPDDKLQLHNIENRIKSISVPTTRVQIPADRVVESVPIITRTREMGTNTVHLMMTDDQHLIAPSELGETLPERTPPMRQFLYEVTTARYLSTIPGIPEINMREVPENHETPAGVSRRHQGTSTTPENFQGDFH